MKIKHGTYKNRSSVVYRNLNPVWNEEFGFKVNELAGAIFLKVYDEDAVTKDDFMGKGEIPLTISESDLGRYEGPAG